MPKFCVGPHVAPGKVYELAKFMNDSNISLHQNSIYLKNLIYIKLSNIF